ncbi:MAG TPA: M28 family metallopeptidase [Roseiflexaceae bacterium]|nr:M28 family metallopeptidase [Roseiflexaceae bacterium]
MARAQSMVAIALIAVTAGCSAPIGEQPVPIAAGVGSPAAATAPVAAPATLPAVATAPATAAPMRTAAPAAAAEPASPTPTPGAVAQPFSGQRALSDVQWLAETIGSRPAGSDAERQAAEGLAERLRQHGYDVALQPFTIQRFEDRGSKLRLPEHPDLALEVHALLNSVAGTVSGRLVYVGLGRTQDLDGRDLRGAIALIERGELTFAAKARNAAAAGAVGALIYNQEPGSFQGALSEAASIPVVALTRADGQRLRELLGGRQLTADLTVDAAMVESTSNNVVAKLPGALEETIVLGAHYDSVAEGPGANDNASGTAVVLELARVLPAAELPYTIQVVLFGSEEIGLVGSRHYVGSLAPPDRERIVAMLNFDMVGVGEQPMVGGSAELVDLAAAAAEQDGLRVGRLGGGALQRSDQAAFLEAGIPAIFFHRSDDPRYHTADDQPAYVDADNLALAGRLALELLEQIAASAPAPA